MIRYAEVLLNYAEALVRDGNVVTQQAVDLLNAVRTSSYPAGVYAIVILLMHQHSLMQYYLREILSFLVKVSVIWIL